MVCFEWEAVDITKRWCGGHWSYPKPNQQEEMGSEKEKTSSPLKAQTHTHNSLLPSIPKSLIIRSHGKVGGAAPESAFFFPSPLLSLWLQWHQTHQPHSGSLFLPHLQKTLWWFHWHCMYGFVVGTWWIVAKLLQMVAHPHVHEHRTPPLVWGKSWDEIWIKTYFQTMGFELKNVRWWYLQALWML